MPETTVTLQHPEGLHARPAALFVKAASQFRADIKIICANWTANAKSILEVLTLGVKQGMTVTIQADGEDAEQALIYLKELVNDNFGDGKVL